MPADFIHTPLVEPSTPSEERPPTYAPDGADGELTVLSGTGAGSAAAVTHGRASIGRAPESDLQLLDDEVSRHHAEVTIDDGVAAIDDLQSTNGTYVNGERIVARHALAPGDRIQIGEATIALTSPVFAGREASVVAPALTSVEEAFAQQSKALTDGSGTRKWWTLAVVSATAFMLVLDVTIVSVALPTISADLHPTFSSLQWVVDAYTLMLTAVLLTAGSLADIFGRKRLLAIGITIFTVASVLSAQSVNATMLDFSRGLQGVGGAIMFACSLALIVQEFPADERGVAFGVYGAINGLGIALGPLLGGLIVQGLGWQWIFYLNVPVGVVSLLVLRRKLLNVPGAPGTKIDWLGLITFSGAMFLATFATIRGNDEGWTSVLILGCYGAAVILLGLFIATELRRERPMFDLSLFRNPTFVGSSVSSIAMSFSLLGLIFYLTIWLQSILGYSPLQAGLRMLAITGFVLLATPIAGRMTSTVDPRITLTAGLVLIAGGVFSMTAISPHSGWTVILAGLCASGIGMGLMNPTLSSTAVGVVPPWRGGMASGINSTCREAGTTAGIAVLGTVLQHVTHVHVQNALARSSLAGHVSTIANAISVGGTPQLLARAPLAARPLLAATARQSYVSGLHSVFIVSFAVAAAGALSALALVRRRHLRYAAGAAAGH